MGAPIAHINCLGINFPITHTSVTQNNCFGIICVIISGLIVVNLLHDVQGKIIASETKTAGRGLRGGEEPYRGHSKIGSCCLFSQQKPIFRALLKTCLREAPDRFKLLRHVMRANSEHFLRVLFSSSFPLPTAPFLPESLPFLGPQNSSVS